eukprot:2847045-Rhodomonas_salina.1
MPGTTTAYGPISTHYVLTQRMGRPGLLHMFGKTIDDLPPPIGTGICACYAMPGTDMPFGSPPTEDVRYQPSYRATRLLCDVRY